MTSTSASTTFQKTIISYITKILKLPSGNRTQTPKQFSQQTQNFHTKKSDSFTNQEQNSQHSLMEGKIQNQIPHLKR